MAHNPATLSAVRRLVGVFAWVVLGLAVTTAAAQPALVPIADVNRDADGDRVPDSLGDSVRIRAVVTSAPFEAQPGPMYRLYLDDGSGGLMLQTADASLVDRCVPGDVVLVEGQVGFYNGSSIITPVTIRVVDTAPVPPPIDVTVSDLIAERYEGQRVRLQGKLVNAQNVELVDETGAIRVRARRILLEDPDFKGRLFSESNVELVGVSSQYDPSPPHDAGYRIEMLSTDDLVVKIDFRPYAWGLGIFLLTGLLWWRARTATRREAFTRGLLQQVRASERALRDSEERMRVVADATSDVIWELDLVRRELFWRGGAKELFGVDIDTQVADRSTHLEFIHEGDEQRVSKSLARAIKDVDESWSAEYRIVREGGEVRHVSDRARILTNVEGEAVRIVGALVDVTERIRAAERDHELQINMQHAQRLESLGILSSGIAHDFNNILAAIVGSADMLRESDTVGSSEKKLIEQITKSCDRGVDLTGKMLTYAGRAPTQRKSVDINQLVGDVVGIVGKAAPKGVVLKSALDPQSPRVDGDPAQFQQVVMNFITNAVESLTDGRGEVCVTTALRTVHSVKGHPVGCKFRPGEYVTLTVTDTGTGIDRGDEAKIFEPFYSTKASGRGLGLSAVVGIISNHDGCLYVDSTPGQGTTFKALLPPGESAAAEIAASPAAMPAQSRDGHVLIADDEEIVSSLIASALRPLDLTTEVVNEGRSALDRILANGDEYDLLVLDLSMPGLNGDEVFSRVRDAGIETPVLFISGHGAHDLERRVGGASNVSILAKPFRVESLRENCLELLARTAAEA